MTAHGSARGWSDRRGAAATWLALAISGISGLVLVLHLERRVEAGGFHRVDPTLVLQRSAVPVDGGWWDARWSRELDWELASTPPFALDDAAARMDLRQRVAALSFVAEVRAGGPGEQGEVVWPDGLRLALRIERPAACVKVGGQFQPVADSGVLLSGTWHVPPNVPGADGGPLPVIGPNAGLWDGARAGDVLIDAHEYAALSIALSLREQLGPADRERLGRILIDARRAHLTAPDEPGARLLLEGGREVYWGRAPSAGEPGELPASIKWAHVLRGLDALDQGVDWRWLDVRWDRPALERGAFPEPAGVDDAAARDARDPAQAQPPAASAADPVPGPPATSGVR